MAIPSAPAILVGQAASEYVRLVRQAHVARSQPGPLFVHALMLLVRHAQSLGARPEQGDYLPPSLWQALLGSGPWDARRPEAIALLDTALGKALMEGRPRPGEG